MYTQSIQLLYVPYVHYMFYSSSLLTTWLKEKTKYFIKVLTLLAVLQTDSPNVLGLVVLLSTPAVTARCPQFNQDLNAKNYTIHLQQKQSLTIISSMCI